MTDLLIITSINELKTRIKQAPNQAVRIISTAKPSSSSRAEHLFVPQRANASYARVHASYARVHASYARVLCTRPMHACTRPMRALSCGILTARCVVSVHRARVRVFCAAPRMVSMHRVHDTRLMRASTCPFRALSRGVRIGRVCCVLCSSIYMRIIVPSMIARCKYLFYL